MCVTRCIVSSTLFFALISLLAIPTFGQFKETYEPPGYLLEWGSNGSGDGQFD